MSDRLRLIAASAALAALSLAGCSFNSELAEARDNKLDKSALDMYMVDRPVQFKDAVEQPAEPVVTNTAEPGKYVSFYGRWQAKIDMKAEMEAEKAKRAAEGKKEDDPAAQMGEAMMEAMGSMMAFDLTINEDKTFSMVMMFFPIEGKWQQKGDRLYLYPEKVMGMSPEEFAKKEGGTVSKADKEPLVLKIAPDNSALIAVDGKDKLGKDEMVFTRPAKA